MRLGRQAIKALPTVTKPTIFYDSELAGFGLRVMPPSSRNSEGAKSWIVEYRPGNGGRGVNKRRLSLGSADVITPEEARSSARDLLAKARLGDDPAERRAEDRTAPTIASLKERYFAETQPTRKPRTREFYEGVWSNHIIPRLGHIRARDLHAGDVSMAHAAIGKKSPTMANRFLALVSHFCNWCERARIRSRHSNPVEELDSKSRFKEVKRKRYLSHREYTSLGAAITKAEVDGVIWNPDPQKKSKHAPKLASSRTTKIDADVADGLRLLLLTGARLREILHLRWTEVDLDTATLNLEDSKTGAKAILLNEAAKAVINRLKARKVKGQIYVIKGDVLDKPRSSLKRPWAIVKELSGLSDLRIHDLRHSFASISVGGGFSLELIGGLLGHNSVSTTQRYAHLADDPLRQANEAVGNTIAALVGEPS